MANVLKMTVIQSILSLHAQGWSHRRIAKTLAINRRTVSRYVRQQRADRSKCTSAPIEPGRLDADSKCTTAPIGSLLAAESAPSDLCFRAAAPRSSTSRCAHWREFILAKRAQGLSVVRVHQDLRGEPGTEAISYDSVRRYPEAAGSPAAATVSADGV